MIKIQVNEIWYPCKLNPKEGFDLTIPEESLKDFKSWFKKNEPRDLNLKADGDQFVCKGSTIDEFKKNNLHIIFNSIRKRIKQ